MHLTREGALALLTHLQHAVQFDVPFLEGVLHAQVVRKVASLPPAGHLARGERAVYVVREIHVLPHSSVAAAGGHTSTRLTAAALVSAAATRGGGVRAGTQSATRTPAAIASLMLGGGSVATAMAIALAPTRAGSTPAIIRLRLIGIPTITTASLTWNAAFVGFTTAREPVTLVTGLMMLRIARFTRTATPATGWSSTTTTRTGTALTGPGFRGKTLIRKREHGLQTLFTGDEWERIESDRELLGWLVQIYDLLTRKMGTHTTATTMHQ
mmetsp:Transcript_13029/g.33241  ORF Transcript_13029/g.33241 Transcript_13029/m.33241 type:complete len:269 (-) Transcript_13029:561-1367(-)